MLHALERLWSVRLPIWLDRWAPRWADALADGAWTAAAPAAAALAPIAAFVLGVLAPHRWPDVAHYGFSASLPFLVVAIVGPILSGAVGVLLLGGLVIGDLSLVGWRGCCGTPNEIVNFVRWGGGHLVSYLLLAVLVQRVPQLGRQLVGDLAERIPGPGAVRRAGLLCLACAGLVFLWSQAFPVLMRPWYTFTGQHPVVLTFVQVQQRWLWLVAAAAVAAVVRIILEEVATRAPRATVARRLEEERWPHLFQEGAAWRRLPAIVPGVLTAAYGTLLLAGAYAGWIDAVLVALFLLGLSLLHAGLLVRLPARWALAMYQVPSLLRMLVAVVVGYAAAYMVLAPLWHLNSFRPYLLGVALTLVVFHVAFPPLRSDTAGLKGGAI